MSAEPAEQLYLGKSSRAAVRRVLLDAEPLWKASRLCRGLTPGQWGESPERVWRGDSFSISYVDTTSDQSSAKRLL